MPSLTDKFAAEEATRPPHGVVEALAGTGKTTTIIEGLKRMMGLPTSITPSPQQAAVWDLMQQSQGGSACFVAYNKAIATELQRRVPTGVQAMTMHALGNRAVRNAFGNVRLADYRTDDIMGELLGKDIRDVKKDEFQMVQATRKLVSMCKNNLVSGEDREELLDLADYYEIEMNGSKEKVLDLVPRVLKRCANVEQDRRIDYDDMIWLPVILNLPVAKYDLLMVDESQDLNRSRQALAKMSGNRLILVGDKHQAIYGFAGADANSMQRMQDELSDTPQGCVVLPLTVTRRCGKAIVAEACKIVPAFEAHESNCEGTIRQAQYKGDGYLTVATVTDFMPEECKAADGLTVSDPTVHCEGCVCTFVPRSYSAIAQPGDMCICRVNAPLVSQCLRFLKAGRKAEIQGRDVGAGLISTIKKVTKAVGGYWEQVLVADLIEAMDSWLKGETEKELKKRNPSDSRLIALQDRHDCIACFTEMAVTAGDVAAKIDAVFTDDPDSPGIKFSTIHKAKGLEAKRVFLLEPEGATVPHPMAKSKWQREQEMNLRYVAITRAIEELVYVK